MLAGSSRLSCLVPVVPGYMEEILTGCIESGTLLLSQFAHRRATGPTLWLRRRHEHSRLAVATSQPRTCPGWPGRSNPRILATCSFQSGPASPEGEETPHSSGSPHLESASFRRLATHLSHERGHLSNPCSVQISRSLCETYSKGHNDGADHASAKVALLARSDVVQRHGGQMM